VPVPQCPQGYNIADYLLEVASDPPVGLFKANEAVIVEAASGQDESLDATEKGDAKMLNVARSSSRFRIMQTEYAATFLTQLQVLSGREWKILRRWV